MCCHFSFAISFSLPLPQPFSILANYRGTRYGKLILSKKKTRRSMSHVIFYLLYLDVNVPDDSQIGD